MIRIEKTGPENLDLIKLLKYPDADLAEREGKEKSNKNTIKILMNK